MLRPVGRVPRMKAKGGGEFVRVLGAEFGDARPILFAGAIDQHVAHSGGGGLGERGYWVGELLEMVVGINHKLRRVRVASWKEESRWSAISRM